MNELEPGSVGDFSAVKDDGPPGALRFVEIEGVGYNQPLRGLFGEFFPPTPQIPGAVSIGFQFRSFDPNLYGNCGSNEYDMPVVGNVLWLMAEQPKQQGK